MVWTDQVCFSTAYLYYVVPRVILFQVEQSHRTLVRKVDFISAPGGSPANVFRTGGPIALVTIPPRQRASRT
jgi:glutaconate CoA-transferase subunit B